LDDLQLRLEYDETLSWIFQHKTYDLRRDPRVVEAAAKKNFIIAVPTQDALSAALEKVGMLIQNNSLDEDHVKQMVLELEKSNAVGKWNDPRVADTIKELRMLLEIKNYGEDAAPEKTLDVTRDWFHELLGRHKLSTDSNGKPLTSSTTHLYAYALQWNLITTDDVPKHIRAEFDDSVDNDGTHEKVVVGAGGNLEVVSVPVDVEGGSDGGHVDMRSRVGIPDAVSASAPDGDVSSSSSGTGSGHSLKVGQRLSTHL